MLCFDEYNQISRSNPRWVVKLDNDETVYQCDTDNNSWADDLLPYLKDNKLSITKIWLQLRSNIFNMFEENAQAYLFTYGFGMLMSPGSNQQSYYNIGTVTNNKTIFIRKIIVPELILAGVDSREAKEEKCLYWNP